MPPWSVPRLWPGQTVAVLASGPSMSQPVADQVRAAGLPTIVINSTFRLAPWAAMLYAADAAWWTHEANRDAHTFDGLKVSVEDVRGVLKLRISGKDGFEQDSGAVRTGGNSGYQALHIAVHAGAARVLLCGYDMHRRHGSHWHGDHPHPLRDTPAEWFEGWLRHYRGLAKILAARGVEVLNCTPGSALDCFQPMPLHEGLSEVAATCER